MKQLFFLLVCLLTACTGLDQAADERIPQAALDTWEYIQKYDKAPPGQVGGRRFGNYEKRLPITGDNGQKLRYREWDIYPKKKGQNRGAERIVSSSENKAYYTPDHYESFILINP